MEICESGHFNFKISVRIYQLRESMKVHSPVCKGDEEEEEEHCQKIKDKELPQTNFKRQYSPEANTITYDTIRKRIHQDQDSNLDNVDTFNPYKSNTNTKNSEFQVMSQQKQEQKPSNDLKEVKEIWGNSLKSRLSHLIPSHLSAQYTVEQRTLMKIQSKIDEFLEYLKGNRSKKRGEFFKNIRRKFMEGDNISVEISHIKQILYLDNQFYKYSRDKDSQFCYDILIDLPADANTTIRKDAFRKKLYQFLQSQKSSDQHQKISIPLFQFPFEDKIETQQKLSLCSKKETKQAAAQAKSQSVSAPKPNFIDIINKKVDFKEKLYQQIREKEIKIKEEEERNKNVDQTKSKLDTRQILRVIDEIHMIYTGKNLSNIFRVNLIEMIEKRFLIEPVIAREMIDVITEHCPMLLKVVEHRQGKLLQFYKKGYAQARTLIRQLKS